MPLESWPHPDVPMPDDYAVIWRYFRFFRFADLVESGELHFCHCDLFKDDNEGLPPDEYIRWVCDHDPIGTVDHVKGSSNKTKSEFRVLLV